MNTRIVTLSLFLTMAAPWGAQATQSVSTPRCTTAVSGNELCEIVFQRGSRSFHYKYETRRAEAGRPTVIAVPGGPGQGLIGGFKSISFSDAIPSDYGVILIDPRGVGANDFGPDPSGAIYSTAEVVRDIEEVIVAERLSNYFIHGQSYGTVVATVLGHSLSHSKLPKPRGILLSGVLDRAFDAPSSILTGYNQQLRRLFDAYPPDQQRNIVSQLQRMEEDFGASKDVFPKTLISVLVSNSESAISNGKYSINMRVTFDSLARNDADPSNQVISYIQDLARIKAKAPTTSNGSRRNDMSETIKCREITRNDTMKDLIFDFERFSLVSLTSDCAEKGYVLDRAYDSAAFQIEGIPLYYIQGLLDPATPIEGAKAHFNRQRTTQKVFVQLDDYAHMGLIGLFPCRSRLWESLEKGVTSFREMIRSCDAKGVTLVN